MLSGVEVIEETTCRFQSLSGFLMRCDTYLLSLYNCSNMFQSLSGFLMRCDFATVTPIFRKS